MRLANRVTLAALSCAILGITMLANARVATGTLAGTVLDARGKTVAGATITMQTSDGLHPHATHTDATGRFEFTRFAIGQYDLRAELNGEFSDWLKRVSIHSHETTSVILHLPPHASESVVVKP